LLYLRTREEEISDILDSTCEYLTNSAEAIIKWFKDNNIVDNDKNVGLAKECMCESFDRFMSIISEELLGRIKSNG
jgi:hypothetical protein